MRLSVSFLIVTLLAAGCAGEKSPKVATMQKKDKSLSCQEVQLEINEAEFYRRAADKNKSPGVGTVLMPLGYISTYVDAGEAAEAADARIEYLNRIYDILDCDNPQNREASEFRTNRKAAGDDMMPTRSRESYREETAKKKSIFEE